MAIPLRLVCHSVRVFGDVDDIIIINANPNAGIVGPPADHLLGIDGVEGATGPRFRKLTPQEIEDYLTSL